MTVLVLLLCSEGSTLALSLFVTKISARRATGLWGGAPPTPGKDLMPFLLQE